MTYRDNMSPDALAAWDRLLQQYGDLTPTSAYRSPEHNAKVGGAKHSQHTHGNAFDVSVAGMPQDQRLAMIEAARKSGFQGIGVYDNALHFDVGPSRAWGGDYTSASLPDWAREAVGAPVGTANALAGTTAPSGQQNALQQQPFMLRPQQNDVRNFLTSAPAPMRLPYT